jgi:hypothetical protein
VYGTGSRIDEDDAGLGARDSRRDTVRSAQSQGDDEHDQDDAQYDVWYNAPLCAMRGSDLRGNKRDIRVVYAGWGVCLYFQLPPLRSPSGGTMYDGGDLLQVIGAIKPGGGR